MSKLQRAIEQMNNREYETAAKLLVEYIDEQPEDPIGYINFANLLVLTNQLQEAERCFLRAIELNDSSATAYYGLGNLYYEQDLLQEAEKMFKYCLTLGLEDADVYFMLGMTYVKRDDMILSLPFLQRATELDEQPESLFQYGLALAKMNFEKEAEVVWHRVLKLDKRHADTLYNLGIVAANKQDNSLALAYFNDALTAQPNHTLALQAKENLI